MNRTVLVETDQNGPAEPADGQEPSDKATSDRSPVDAVLVQRQHPAFVIEAEYPRTVFPLHYRDGCRRRLSQP